MANPGVGSNHLGVKLRNGGGGDLFSRDGEAMHATSGAVQVLLLILLACPLGQCSEIDVRYLLHADTWRDRNIPGDRRFAENWRVVGGEVTELNYRLLQEELISSSSSVLATTTKPSSPETTPSPVSPLPPQGDRNICGDGYLSPSELCDDGNTANGDGCSSDCQTIEQEFMCSSSIQGIKLDIPSSIYTACSLCVDKPYSDSITEDDLNKCSNLPNLVLAATDAANQNKIVLSAMIPSAMLTSPDLMKVTEVVPGTFFYNNPMYSVGFSPTASVHLNPYDDLAHNCSERLSWTIGGPGGRAGCTSPSDLSSMRKRIFSCPATWFCPEKSECTIGENWDNIVQDEWRYFSGGLGTEMIIGEEEVWVCDRSNLCAPNSMDAACFKYHEVNQSFSSWGFQDSLVL
eukprot:746725-Hanusia_phi.AAC.1